MNALRWPIVLALYLSASLIGFTVPAPYDGRTVLAIMLAAAGGVISVEGDRR